MNYKFLMMVCAVFLFQAINITSPALARKAKCLITSGGTTEFSGTCDFQSEPNGSFSLSRANRSGRFLQNVDAVTVYVLSKGRADVRGLTKAGINSRWGSAKRSRKDRACWIGDGFKICAW